MSASTGGFHSAVGVVGVDPELFDTDTTDYAAADGDCLFHSLFNNFKQSAALSAGVPEMGETFRDGFDFRYMFMSWFASHWNQILPTGNYDGMSASQQDRWLQIWKALNRLGDRTQTTEEVAHAYHDAMIVPRDEEGTMIWAGDLEIEIAALLFRVVIKRFDTNTEPVRNSPLVAVFNGCEEVSGEIPTCMPRNTPIWYLLNRGESHFESKPPGLTVDGPTGEYTLVDYIGLPDLDIWMNDAAFQSKLNRSINRFGVANAPDEEEAAAAEAAPARQPAAAEARQPAAAPARQPAAAPAAAPAAEAAPAAAPAANAGGDGDDEDSDDFDDYDDILADARGTEAQFGNFVKNHINDSDPVQKGNLDQATSMEDDLQQRYFKHCSSVHVRHFVQLNSTSADLSVCAGSRPFPLGFAELAVALPNSQLITPSASVNDRKVTSDERKAWNLQAWKHGFVRNKSKTSLTLRRDRETSVESKLLQFKDMPKRLSIPKHTFTIFSNFSMMINVVVRNEKSNVVAKQDEPVNVKVELGDNLFVFSTASLISGVLERIQAAYEARKSSFPAQSAMTDACESASHIQPYEHEDKIGVTRQFQVNSFKMQSSIVKKSAKVTEELEKRMSSQFVPSPCTDGAELKWMPVFLQNPFHETAGLVPRNLVLYHIDIFELTKSPDLRRALVSDALADDEDNEKFYKIYSSDSTNAFRNAEWTLPSIEQIRKRLEEWHEIYDQSKECLQYAQTEREKLKFRRNGKGTKGLRFYITTKNAGRARSIYEIDADIILAINDSKRDETGKKELARALILERGRTALTTVSINIDEYPKTGKGVAFVTELSVKCTNGTPPSSLTFKRAIAKALMRLFVSPDNTDADGDWSFSKHCSTRVKIAKNSDGGKGGDGGTRRVTVAPDDLTTLGGGKARREATKKRAAISNDRAGDYLKEAKKTAVV